MTQTDSSPAQRQGPEPGNNSSYPVAPCSSSAPSMATASTQVAPMQSYSSYPEGQASPPYPYGASNMSSLNLPPIRSIDGRPQQQPPPPQPVPPQQQQQQQQQQHQHQQPQVHHPQQAQQQAQQQQHAHQGAGQPVPFFSPYPMAHPQDPVQPMRYPLPPNPDGRILSGGRHKKEIKRRTKTGCLTCRKRRIKCDEGHPACRNCQKSKRECLGYDPIFKPQPGTPAIQPAFTQYPAMSHPAPPPPAQRYPLAAYGVFVAQEDEQQGPAEKADTSPDDSVKQENGVEAARVNGSDPQHFRAKQTKIQDLLCINGVPTLPPAPPSTRTPDQIGQMLEVYELIYQPGMDKFFETQWFKKRGFEYLKANGPLCDQFQNLISRYSMSDNKEDPAYLYNLAITQSLEAMVIWAMLGLCRKAATTKDAAGNINTDDEREDVMNTVKRLDMFEALVTGEYLTAETAPATTPPDTKLVGNTLEKQLAQNQYTFWFNIHRFLTLHNGDPDFQKQIDEVLSECRKTLENRESRDVIYSIMVVRHIGPTIPGFPNAVKAPETDEEQEAQIAITVAKRLVEEEAGDKGTNQVVTRLCGLAARSWALNIQGTPVTGP